MKNNQEFSLDGLRESVYSLFRTLGSRSRRLIVVLQVDLGNISLHGVRQVGVRTRTDVFLAGFLGPAKSRS
jgi:hypothetical protein